jgi:hypothetical protein
MSPHPTDAELVAYFHKHLVPLYAIFSIRDKAACYVATAFVLSAEDEWFLITAGHVAIDIIDQLKDPSCRLRRAFLDDAGGLDAKDRHSVPFDLTPENIAVLGDEKTLDYAVIHLGQYYRRLLEKNGVEPLDERVWLHQPINPELHFIIGVPRKLISVEWGDPQSIIRSLGIVTTLHRVTYLPHRPTGLGETTYPRWYGTITTDDRLQDIRGMMGNFLGSFVQEIKKFRAKSRRRATRHRKNKKK